MNNKGSITTMLRGDVIWTSMFVAILLSVLLAYVLPERPFTIWPWTEGFVEFVASFVLAIDRLAEFSKMPQVTRLFMAIEWVIWGPICFFLFTKFNRLSEKSVTTWMRVALTRWWYSLFFPPLSLIVFSMFVTLWPLDTLDLIDPDPFEYIIILMSRDRLWLGLFGSVFVFMGVGAVFGLLKSFTFIRLAYAVRASSPLHKGRNLK